MKKQLFVLLVLLSFAEVNSQSKKSIDLNWHSDFEKAKELAISQNKHILIYFTGSDWSKSCKMLNNDFFYTEKFQKIALENLILVRVNSPKRPNLISNFQKDKNQELSKIYNQKVYPTVVITNTKGDKLGMIESYNYLHDTGKHYALINKIIKR